MGVKVWQRRKSFHASARRKEADVAYLLRIVAISRPYFLPRVGVVPGELIRNRESASPRF